MRLYFYSLTAVVAVYFIHMHGLNGGYMQFPRLDVISHFMVCLSIALALGALIYSLWPSMPYKAVFIIIVTFSIGVAWEWLEAYYDITGYPLWSTLYYIDTTRDFIVDLIGASLGAYISIKKL